MVQRRPFAFSDQAIMLISQQCPEGFLYGEVYPPDERGGRPLLRSAGIVMTYFLGWDAVASQWDRASIAV